MISEKSSLFGTRVIVFVFFEVRCANGLETAKQHCQTPAKIEGTVRVANCGNRWINSCFVASLIFLDLLVIPTEITEMRENHF